MLNHSSRRLTLVTTLATFALIVAFGLAPGRVDAQGAGLTVDELRQGGYVIFFRHVTADDGIDMGGLDVDDCAQQRNIREAGLRDARTIGIAFRMLNIPVETVYSSEYCRAKETAGIAFGRYEVVPSLNLCCADTRPISNEERLAYVARAVTLVPPEGKNTVIVAHGVGIVADLAMGEAAIYRPDGQGGTVRVGRAMPGEWMSGVYPRTR